MMSVLSKNALPFINICKQRSSYTAMYTLFCGVRYSLAPSAWLWLVETGSHDSMTHDHTTFIAVSSLSTCAVTETTSTKTPISMFMTWAFPSWYCHCIGVLVGQNATKRTWNAPTTTTPVEIQTAFLDFWTNCSPKKKKQNTTRRPYSFHPTTTTQPSTPLSTNDSEAGDQQVENTQEVGHGSQIQHPGRLEKSWCWFSMGNFIIISFPDFPNKKGKSCSLHLTRC